jgi:hypothetical protein
VPLHLCSADGDVRLIATISTFVTALDVTVSELRLEAFLPANPQTAAILVRRLRTKTEDLGSDAAYLIREQEECRQLAN